MLSPTADQTEEDEHLQRLQSTSYRPRQGLLEAHETPFKWEYVVPASGCIVLPSIRMWGSTHFPKKLPYVFGTAVAGYIVHGFYLIVKSSEASTPVWYEQSISTAQTRRPGA